MKGGCGIAVVVDTSVVGWVKIAVVVVTRGGGVGGLVS